MKRFGLTAAAAGCAALALTSFTARAGFGEGHGRGAMGMAPLMSVLEPQQREQVHAIFMNDRSRLDLLHAQLREAREALITKLLSPAKTVDVTDEVAKLKRAQEQLIDERIKLALQARKIMSSEQLAKALALWSKWQALRAQERALFEEARNENNAGNPSAASAPAQSRSKR
jgi:hypothetical protein